MIAELYISNYKNYYISNHRFGFNGKEYDNEVKGNGNQQDYGFRIYDPRIGKFLSIDPLFASYPELSTYQFASNTPISAIDLDGLEAKQNITLQRDGTTIITTTIALKVKNTAKMSSSLLIGSAFDIANQIEDSFIETDIKNKIIYKYEVHLDFDNDINSKNDFYLDFVNKVEGATSEKTVGRTSKIGNTNKNRFQVKVKGRSADGIKKTGSHEIGHGLGLRHDKKIDNKGKISLEEDNLMRQSKESNGTIINNEQRELVSKTIKDNRGGGEIKRLEPIQIKQIEVR